MSLRDLYETDDPDFILFVNEVTDFVGEQREAIREQVHAHHQNTSAT